MSSIEHKIAKAKLKDIATTQEFEDYISLFTFSDLEKDILRKVYIQGKSYIRIAEELDYSAATIKLKHAQCLKKIK